MRETCFKLFFFLFFSSHLHRVDNHLSHLQLYSCTKVSQVSHSGSQKKLNNEFIRDKMHLCSLHVLGLGAPGCDQPFTWCFGVLPSAAAHHEACWCMNQVCSPSEHPPEHYAKESLFCFCLRAQCFCAGTNERRIKSVPSAAAVRASMSSPPASLSLPFSVPHYLLLFFLPCFNYCLTPSSWSCLLLWPPCFPANLSALLHLLAVLNHCSFSGCQSWDGGVGGLTDKNTQAAHSGHIWNVYYLVI